MDCTIASLVRKSNLLVEEKDGIIGRYRKTPRPWQPYVCSRSVIVPNENRAHYFHDIHLLYCLRESRLI